MSRKARKRRAAVKRGRDRIRSQAGSDRRPMDQMSMERKRTREVYEAREIEKAPPDRKQERKDTQASLNEFQRTLKPIRSSQKTDLN